MNVLAPLAIAVLVGAGVYAMLARDIVRIVAGTLLLSNAAVLFLLAADLDARAAPLSPLPELGKVADPLVQALALTGIVINFGIAILVLRLGIEVERSHDTISVEDLAASERDDARREEGDT